MSAPQIVPTASSTIVQGKQFWRMEDPVLGKGPGGNTVVKVGGMWAGQRAWWNLPNFVKLYVAGYGAGKTNINCKRAISSCLYNAPAPAAVVSPTYRMARDTLVITIKSLLAGKASLLDDFSWYYRKGEKIFYIQHGSREGQINVYSGEEPENLRGPNLGSAFIDEPFLQQYDVFTQMVARVRHPDARRPEIGLTGCVTRDTLVCTPKGLVPIGNLDPGCSPKGYKKLGVPVYGLDRAFHTATQFYNNGRSRTVKVRVRGGYRLEATPDQKIWVMGDCGVPEWRAAEDLRVGDWVAISRGMEAWGDEDPCEGFVPNPSLKVRYRLPTDLRMTTDLAYFLGLWLAEGNVSGDTVTITCGDKSVGRSLVEEGVIGLRFRAARDGLHWHKTAAELVALMRHVGMPLVHAPKKRIPQWVFRGRREWALAFLAGMYDGDGCVHKDGMIQYTSSSKRMLLDLQALLLNLGIVSRMIYRKTAPTELCKNSGYGGHVCAYNNNAAKLARELPLRIKRKRDRLVTRVGRDSDPVPHQGQLVVEAWGHRRKLRWRKGESKLDANITVRSARLLSGRLSYGTLQDFVNKWDANEDHQPAAIVHLKKTLHDWYWWGPVTRLGQGEAETVDFCVPKTNSFWAGGTISKNTPEQLNWGYDLCLGELRPQYDVGFVQASTRQNLAVGDTYVKRLEGAFTKKAGDAYIEGAFVSLSEGQVYYAFRSILTGGDDVSRGNVRDIPIPEGAELGCGMDFNVNPMAFVVFWHHRDHVHFFDEYELPNADTQYACSVLREHYVDKNKGERRLPEKYVLREVFPDATGNARRTSAPEGKSDFYYLRQAGFEVRAHDENPKVRDREEAVNGKLGPKVGTPTMTVAPKCKRLIKYLTVYAHELKNKPEQKAMSHLLDSAGYPIAYLWPVARESLHQFRVF